MPLARPSVNEGHALRPPHNTGSQSATVVGSIARRAQCVRRNNPGIIRADVWGQPDARVREVAFSHTSQRPKPRHVNAIANCGAKSGALVAQNAGWPDHAQSDSTRKEVTQSVVSCTIAQNEKRPLHICARAFNGRNRARTCDLGYVTAAL